MALVYGTPLVQALNDANTTLRGARQAQQETEAHEADMRLAELDAQRLEAEGEAFELETQIRRDAHEEAQQLASVQGFLRRGLMDPTQFDAEGYAEAAEGLNIPEADSQAGQIAAMGRALTQQQDLAAEFGQALQMQIFQAATGASQHRPGLAEELTAVHQKLQEWSMNPLGGGQGPMELAAQAQQLLEQDREFQMRRDDMESAGRAFDSRWGSDPKLAPYKQMYADPETRVQAVKLIHEIEEPEAAASARQEAQAEVIEGIHRETEEAVLAGLYENGIELGSPEADAWTDNYIRGRRALLNRMQPGLGTRVFPLTEFEQGIAEAERAYAEYAASGIDIDQDEEAYRAARQGLSPVEYRAMKAAEAQRRAKTREEKAAAAQLAREAEAGAMERYGNTPPPMARPGVGDVVEPEAEEPKGRKAKQKKKARKRRVKAAMADRPESMGPAPVEEDPRLRRR